MLTASIQQTASDTSEIAYAEFKELAAEAEQKLQQSVSGSVGVAALIGYL